MQTETVKGSYQPTEGFKRAGACILEMFSIFKKYHRESQIQTFSIFLCIAHTPGITMFEIGRKTGRAQSTVWRNVEALSEESDLVVALDDPAEPRRKVVHLTKKGQKLAKEVSDSIDRFEQR